MATLHITDFPAVLAQDLPDVPDAVVKATKDFTLFTWKPASAYNETFFFRGTGHGYIASFFNKRVSVTGAARQFALLDRTDVQARNSRLQDFNRTRLILADKLDATWGNGRFAENYLDCALRNRVSVGRLVNCSSLILDCLDGSNMARKPELQKFSQNSIIRLCETTSDVEELNHHVATLNDRQVQDLVRK